MSWNYRVCKETVKYNEDEETTLYSIKEVYYNLKGEIEGQTENPVKMEFESLEDLKWALDKFRDALGKDVVDLDTIVYPSQKQ
jgi:hypothetical protein